METLLNQSGSVKMYDKNNAYLVTYKRPFEIQNGKEYIILDGFIKEVVSKKRSLPIPFDDAIKKFIPKGFLPNDIYDENSLEVWLGSNRGNFSPNAKRLELLENIQVNGRTFEKGYTMVLDLEYKIDASKVYALYDKDGEDLYFLCSVEEIDQYFVITSEDNNLYKVAKEDFFNKYSLYVGLYLQKRF